MMVMVAKVRKYGIKRRHIEVSIDDYEFFPVGSRVVVLLKDEYESLVTR